MTVYEWTDAQLMALTAAICEERSMRSILNGLLGLNIVPFHEDVRRLYAGEALAAEKMVRLDRLSRLLRATAETIDIKIETEKSKHQ